MKIKNIEIKNNLILAPMAGYTDVGFRRLCAKSGAGITYTEMISAKALLHNSKKTEELLYTDENELVCAVQIFGHEPQVMAMACKNPLLQKFDIIDINMGCPAPKIVKNGDGSKLLTNIKLAGEIVKACVEATNKPITVKMRLGYGDDNVAVEFARYMEKMGASALTIHGRTQSQMYMGDIDKNTIKLVKQTVKIPVIANGNVNSKKLYEEMLKETNADAVMIGRGALGSPYIFGDILGKDCNHNKSELICEHISTLKKYYSERFIVLSMRKHIAFYLKNTNAPVLLKQKLMLEENLDNLINMLKEFFNK